MDALPSTVFFHDTVVPKLLRRRSRQIPMTTPPPLPLISLPPDDEWEEFDVPTRSGFGYELPHLEHLVLEDETQEEVQQDDQTAKRCKVLSEYMTQNECFQIKRHGFGLEYLRLVYKRTKPPHGPAILDYTSPTNTDDVQFDAFFESGNLDRAYRVIGRHYATQAELLGLHPDAVSMSILTKVDMEYDLYCDTDMHTHGHIQWYFFRTTIAFPSTSTTTRLKVRFNLRNMLKKASLYNDGMLPVVYIESPAQVARGWHHAGTNVCYFRNSETYRNRKTGKMQNYYTLSFVYDYVLPDHGHDATRLVVYFAHCYPYTYTRLQKYLLSLQKDPERNRFFKRRVLCKTVAGNQCDLLTITDFGQDDDQDTPYDQKRPGIVISARVHPGESNASFIMHGIIDFLTGPSLEARFLRHRFIYKIIPMLNPDGVIHGNYRCSLSGTDLNRRWIKPSLELHPTIYATKNVVLFMKKTRPVLLFCDIHGHSRKKNIFLYGCKPFESSLSAQHDSAFQSGMEVEAGPGPGSGSGPGSGPGPGPGSGPGATSSASIRAQAARVRLFPHILSKTSNFQRHGYYSFPDSTFTVTPSKKGTGRVVVWREAEVLHSFTLEASFFGVGVNRKSKDQAPSNNQSTPQSRTKARETDASIPSRHFTPHDLRLAGIKFCQALVPFAQVTIGFTQPSLQSTSPSSSMRSLLLRPSSPPLPALSPTGSSLETKPFLYTRPGSASSPDRRRLEPLVFPADTRPVTAAGAFEPPSFASTNELASCSRAFESFLSQDSAFSSMFSLSHDSADDLLKEIEADMPSTATDGGWDHDEDDDASAGSESDPSGDDMEAEELERRGSWKNLMQNSSSASTSPAKNGEEASNPSDKLATKQRLRRVIRHFSTSRLDDIVDQAKLKDVVDAAMHRRPSHTNNEVEQQIASLHRSPQKLEPIQRPPSVVNEPSASLLAMAAQRNSLVRAAALDPAQHPNKNDRNRDIAAMHRCALQRRYTRGTHGATRRRDRASNQPTASAQLHPQVSMHRPTR